MLSLVGVKQVEVTTWSKGWESYQGIARGPLGCLFLSRVDQKMMLFTPMQATCALLEDPTLFGEPLVLFSALQLQTACPIPCPRTPVPSPSHIHRSVSFLHSHFLRPLLSVAKALCVKTVGAQALKLFQEHRIFSEVVSDQEAVAAIEKFVGMFQVLSRPNLLVQELSSCPVHLVCQGTPSLQIFLIVLSLTPSYNFPLMKDTTTMQNNKIQNRKTNGTHEEVSLITMTAGDNN